MQIISGQFNMLNFLFFFRIVTEKWRQTMTCRFRSLPILALMFLMLAPGQSAVAEITAVIAGTGLEGGGSEGDVTLSIEVPMSLDSGGGAPTIAGDHSGAQAGVRGQNTAANTLGYLGDPDQGVRGEHSSGTSGVLGFINYGAGGEHSSGRLGFLGGRDYGVYGTNDRTTPRRWGYIGGDQYAVFGRATGPVTGGHAGHFEANGTDYIGVYAEAGGPNGRGGEFTVTGRGAHAVHATATHYSQHAGYFDGRVRVTVLEVAGADLSENFRVSATREDVAPSPGMVVSIDPDQVGDLIVSAGSYDRRVAGIISGARDVKPGVLMGAAGDDASPYLPVALTGRVYCWANAANGAIEPGDLLTTSETPGHAMKVTDPARAQGAILGKAMTSLVDGRGLVLVLVALQ